MAADLVHLVGDQLPPDIGDRLLTFDADLHDLGIPMPVMNDEGNFVSVSVALFRGVFEPCSVENTDRAAFCPGFGHLQIVSHRVGVDVGHIDHDRAVLGPFGRCRWGYR